MAPNPVRPRLPASVELRDNDQENFSPPRPMGRRYIAPMRNVVPRGPNGIHPRLAMEVRNRAAYEAYEEQYRMMSFYEWLQSCPDEA